MLRQHFQATVNLFLKPFLRKLIIVFFDDSLITAILRKTFEPLICSFIYSI